MRMRDPKTTALIFQSGKVIITGAKSEALALLAAKKYTRTLQLIGLPHVVCAGFTLQNLVAGFDTRFPIALDSLSSQHSEFTSYEPELFPGVIYRMQDPKLVLIIFVSGKVVVTGAKSTKQLITAVEEIVPILRVYKK